MPIVTKTIKGGKVTYNLNLTLPLVLLTLLFVILKMTGITEWSWWTVTSPLWFLPLVIVALVAFLFAVWALVSIGMLLTGRRPKLKYTFKRR